MPVHVPKGISIADQGVVLHGFAQRPRRASAKLTEETFFAGLQGEKQVGSFAGRMENDFQFAVESNESVIWSPCGQDTILPIDASSIANSNSRGQETLIAVDSITGALGSSLKLRYRRCPALAPIP